MPFTTLPYILQDASEISNLRIDIPRTAGHRGKVILKVLNMVEDHLRESLQRGDDTLLACLQPFILQLNNTWFVWELGRSLAQTQAMAHLVQYCQNQSHIPDKSLNKYYDYLQYAITEQSSSQTQLPLRDLQTG